MSEINDPANKKKPWTKPELKKIKLTDDEVAALRASDDPMALLMKLKPELGRKKPS